MNSERGWPAIYTAASELFRLLAMHPAIHGWDSKMNVCNDYKTGLRTRGGGGRSGILPPENA